MDIQTIKRQKKCGKLLKVQFNLDNSVYKNVRITGDFFVHPETFIEELEEYIDDKSYDTLNLEDYFSKSNAQIIGFSSKDLLELLQI